MTLPPTRVITLEPRHEPPKPGWHWLACVACFAPFIQLFF